MTGGTDLSFPVPNFRLLAAIFLLLYGHDSEIGDGDTEETQDQQDQGMRCMSASQVEMCVER